MVPRWISTNWRAAVLAIACAALFWWSGPLFQWLDPSAGTFDAGVIQSLVLGLALFAGCVWAAWVVFSLEFPTLDRWIDAGRVCDDWEQLRPQQRWGFMLCAFFGLLFAACWCVSLAAG